MRSQDKLNMQREGRPVQSTGSQYRNRHDSFQRWGLLLLVPVCCLTARLAMAAPVAPPVDANALVRQMVSTYQKTQTYEEDSDSTTIDQREREYIQQTHIKFKRPNLLIVASQDPQNGTLKTDSNGRNICFYSGRSNIYSLRNAPATIQGVLAEMSHMSLQMIHTPISSVLSPLSFLSAKGMPVEAQSFTYAGSRLIQGRRTVLVKAQANPLWLRTIIPPNLSLNFVRRDITLAIDPVTKLLVWSDFNLVWNVDTGGTPVAGKLRMTETHRNMVPNAPLRDEDFTIQPPKGAQEMFPGTR